MLFRPQYSEEFHCIGKRCRHNCCIGWEIDIDEETREYYRGVGGKLQKRLSLAIDDEGTPHFRLGRKERCPFLNRRNLCDIILTLGEGALCEICREHPRYYHTLSYGVEMGYGLCCEEAARIVLGEKEKVTLVSEEGLPPEITDPWEEALYEARATVIGILTDRMSPLFSRIERLILLSGLTLPSFSESLALLEGLEILSDSWKKLLLLAKEDDGEHQGFDRHMAERTVEYEQIGVYLAYRYLIAAFDEEALSEEIAFIAWSLTLLYRLGSAIYRKKRRFRFTDAVELSRLFSSEIEYSTENREEILALLGRR